MPLQGGLGGSSLGGGLGGGLGVQQFDTGLARPQRTLIRQHIAAALAPMLKLNGGYLHKIGVLPRPLRGRDEDELGLLVSAVLGRSPCVLVALGAKSYESIGLDATEELGELEVAIYAVSSNARSFVEGRLEQDAAATSSANADPGIETMLEHCEQLLLGQGLGLSTAHEMRGRTEEEVYTFEEYTVWEQTYALKVSRDINVSRAIADICTVVAVANNLDDADLVNPVVETETTLEVPTP